MLKISRYLVYAKQTMIAVVYRVRHVGIVWSAQV